MRPIPDIAVEFISKHEGCRLTAYQDAANPPVWTVGYGSTAGVHAGLTITPAEAKARLKTDLQQAATRIEMRIGSVVDDLTENQYAALLSLVFNVGAGPSWEIWKLLRAKLFDQAALEFAKFTKAGGKRLQGLVNRRADEFKLWCTDEPGSVPDAPPSSETRVADTPPTPDAPPKPLAKQASFVTKAAGLAVGAGGVAAQYAPTVKGWADQLKDYTDSPIIQHVATGMITVAGGLLVVSLIASVLKQRTATK